MMKLTDLGIYTLLLLVGYGYVSTWPAQASQPSSYQSLQSIDRSLQRIARTLERQCQ